MTTVPLGDLIASASVRRAGDGDYPLLSMTMRDGLVDQSAKFKKRIASNDISAYKVVLRGQLVVGFPIDEGVLDFQRLYECGIVSPAYGVWNLRDESTVERGYLQKFLRSPLALAYYRAKLRGSTARRRSLPTEVFLALPVPLPLPDEQRRIAAILDQADALRNKRRQVIVQLDGLAQATYRDMFRGGEWPQKPIELLGRISTGKTPPTSEPGMFDGPIPFVTPGDLNSGREVARSVSTAGAQASRVVRKGATLVCCIGATIGKVDRAHAACAFNQQINAVEWHGEIDDTYGLESVRELKPVIVAAGASTTMPLLPKGRFGKLSIAVAPVPLQKLFASRTAHLTAQRAIVQHALELDDQLYSSIQARAFRGEL